MRARLFRASAAAFIALLATASGAGVASSTQAPSASREARAAELARIVHPEEVVMASAIEAMDTYLVDTLLKQDDVAEMEAAYPGITKAMYVAARPLLVAAEHASAAKVREGLKDLYLAEFMASEVEDLLRFYSGPTGRKVIALMLAPSSVKDIYEDVLADPELQLSSKAAARTHVKAALGMAGQLTLAERQEAAAFARTPAGSKVAKVAPKMRAMAVGVVNAPLPEHQAKVDQAMLSAAEEFMERTGD